MLHAHRSASRTVQGIEVEIPNNTRVYENREETGAGEKPNERQVSRLCDYSKQRRPP